MTFYKILSAFIIALSIFSSNAFSMEGEKEEESYHSSISVYLKEDIDEKTSLTKKEKSYSHWGLSHWFSGITEYFDRCCCCSTNNDLDRKYITRSRDTGNIVGTSDCCFIAEGHKSPSYKGCLDNPITGTLCCPFAAIAHLCCLPCACCDSSEDKVTQTEDLVVEPLANYPHSHPQLHYKTSEEKEEEAKKREQAYQAWRIGELKSGDLNRKLNAGWRSDEWYGQSHDKF